MSYERVSQPAFWMDYPQYIKAMGLHTNTSDATWSWRNALDQQGGRIPLWDLNPAKMLTYEPYEESDGNLYTTMHFGMKIISNDDWINAPADYKLQLARFISTANFAGLLGHNLHSAPSSAGVAPGWRVYPAYFSGAITEPSDSPIDPGGWDGIYGQLRHATDGSDKVFGGDWKNEASAGDAYIIPSSDGYILADYTGGASKLPETIYDDGYYTYPDDYEDPNLAGTTLTQPIYGYETYQNIRMFVQTADGTTNLDLLDSCKMGSHVIGRKFVMPTSPNMSLTQSYEFDGTKTQTTRGGSTLTNTMWHSPPNWGDLPAWGRNNVGENTLLNERNFLGGRRGRRTWRLKFAFMSESDVYPKHILKSDGTDFHDMSGITNLATGTHSASDTLYGILSLSLGGALPFIFQPDKDEDNFAIVRFDQKSLKFRQASHRTYDFSANLEEVW